MVMSGSTRPTCYIYAGANGAGKTTFALNYLPKIVSCRNFINVDEIARGVSHSILKQDCCMQGRIFLQLMRQKIAQREDFAFETTLSGKSWLRRIRQMQNKRMESSPVLLYIPSAAVSKSRVKQRVEQGGHDIPIADLERRYPPQCHQPFCIY